MAEADPGRRWPLPEDLTREIFARAGYNEPLRMFQVACSCKDWFVALSDADYARRLRNHGVTPVPLGFLHDLKDQGLPTFLPTLRSPFVTVDAPDRRHWKVMDYRNNRVLLLSKGKGDLGRRELLVWDPITGAQRRFPVAPEATDCIYPGAALVCTMPGCTHCPACKEPGEFRVALLFSAPMEFEDEDDGEEGRDSQLRCFVYSSESDTWAEEVSLYGLSEEEFGRRPSVMAEGCLYFLSDDLRIFKLDLDDHTLTEVELPDMEDWSKEEYDSLILMVREDSLLGLVETTKGSIYAWSRSNNRWDMTLKFDHYFTSGTIGLENHSLLGFVEGTSVFFVSSSEGLFLFELPPTMVKEPDELKVKKLQIRARPTSVFPVVSLYTPYKVIKLQNERAKEPCPKRTRKV